jgi:2-polyprenyl-6-methoxyphenol hydroxylase-like FAD-dependent oxidoreductase
MGTREVRVLVAGAGPAGLTAAIALARHGVLTLLVERRRDLSSLPRATVVSTRSMEIFRSWGLEERIRAGGPEVEWLLWACETLAGAAAGSGHAVGYPTREQAAVLSPTGPACVPQDHLEPVLLAHLRALPTAKVLLGTEVVDVFDGPDAVRVTLRDTVTGATRVADAAYLVAADGAHSAVRRAVGLPMHGPDRLTAAATALFHAPLWELLGTRRYGIYGVDHPEGPGTFLPAGRDDRWLYGVQYDADREEPDDFTIERFSRLIRLGAGVPGLTPRHRADRHVHVRRPTRRAFPCGPGVPGRRCRAPGYPARRNRHEHRDRRRLRPGLEARLGAARLGRSAATRLLRGRAPARRGAQRVPVGRPVRLPAPRGPGTARRSRRAHPASVAAARTRLHPRPARTRAGWLPAGDEVQTLRAAVSRYTRPNAILGVA